jgi:glycosyltransferase involved in cell wall biosynthesis
MTEGPPDISIVMPVHDGARFLPASIGSCLRELTTGVRGEVLIVDDHSSDDSLAMARDYGAPVRVLALQGARGRSAARNLGLRSAAGTFVKFLDQDDDLEPGSLPDELELACARRADIVVSGYRIAPLAAPADESSPPFPPPALSRGIDSLLAGESVPTAAALYRRSYLRDLEWAEPPTKLDDWRFFLAAALLGGRIERRSSPAYTWRQHPGQASRAFDLLGNAISFYGVLDWLEGELRRRGELTERRMERLAQYRYKELRVLCRFDRPRFEREVEKIRSLDPRFAPRDEERQWWMRWAGRLLGYRRAVLLHTRLRAVLMPKAASARAPLATERHDW